MKVIELIGGVGAGKSSILNSLKEDYHAVIIQADLVAKELMKPGEAGYLALVEAFGKKILKEDGTISSPALAELMFRDSGVLQRVNQIIHPLVWQEIKRRILAEKERLIIVETAVPAEKTDDICDEVWYVYTSEETRIRRLQETRGYSQEKSQSMMAGQLSDAEFRALADRVIDNNGTQEETKQQIDIILKSEGR